MMEADSTTARDWAAVWMGMLSSQKTIQLETGRVQFSPCIPYLKKMLKVKNLSGGS